MTISIAWTGFISKWFTAQKIYSKMFSTSCTNIDHDVIASKIDGMVEEKIKS